MNVLETQVLQLIGENTDSPDVFTDDAAGIAPIRDSINDAIEEIAMVTGSQKLTIHVPLVEDKMFYRLNITNGSFGWITDAWLVNVQKRLNQSDFIKLNLYNPRWMINKSYPDDYMQVGTNVVGFHPRPSASFDMVELTAVVIPNRYTEDTDRIKVRDAFQRAVVHYAVSEYWATRGDAREARKHFIEYLGIVGLRDLVPGYQERMTTLRTDKRESTNPTQTDTAIS